jgi:ABC-type glutathione transport system ATPase component
MVAEVEAGPGPEIRFENITTSWAATQTSDRPASTGSATRPEALSDLSLTVPAGEITVLLGDHQSGKSLLALHLLGELPTDTGRVVVSGESVWDLPDGERQALNKRFGVLRGGTALKETDTETEVSVFDNVVRELRDTEAADRAETAAHEVLRHFDLGDVEQMSPRDLDPAARRRLAVATALADDPRVVVIDDPGEALDSEHLEHMVESIRGWHARTHSTMIIGARSLRVARELADQVVVLKDGRVAGHGAPGTVLKDVVDDDSYEERFGTPLGGNAEADPERNRRGLRKLNLVESRRQLWLVVAFFVLAVATVVGLLTSGVLDQGTGDNGGEGAQTSSTSMGPGH